MPDAVTMRFTFPDGEEQEHSVPVPLPRIIELVQRREYDFSSVRAPPMPVAVRFRRVDFADNTGRSWSEYDADP